MSHTLDDLTPQQSSDTSEESHVLAPRDDELPMGAVTHLSPIQTPMIATSHEEISGMTGMMDELSVRDAHHGLGRPTGPGGGTGRTGRGPYTYRSA
jgi:hypothetical protein